MANIAHNDVTIYSKNRAALEAFRDRVNNTNPEFPKPFSLDKLRPTPNLEGWDLVEWRRKNWGTRLDALFSDSVEGVSWHDPDDMTPSHYRLDYHFDTVWNAPTPLFEELKASNPELSFWWDCISIDSDFQFVWWSKKGFKRCPDPLREDGGSNIREELAEIKRECELELETLH